MKYFFFVLITIIFSSSTNAQVGINTTNPRATLDVAGDMYILGAGSGLQTNLEEVLEGQDFALLAQTSTGFIKEMNTNNQSLAFGYFQEYVISNMNGDWIENLNTNLDSSKYHMIIMSAYFDREIEVADANFILPYVSTFTQGSPPTWRITADYPEYLPRSGNGVWTILTLILPNEFSKELPRENVTMSGNNTARRTGAKSGDPIIK